MQIILPSKSNKFLILIPLVLGGYVHLWNLSGFPDMFYDEGYYIRRALNVMAGLGPQEGSFYDHPYFGQLFLAGIFSLISYPSSLDPQVTDESVSLLFAVPRLVMGMLAILDTFLVYKITQLRYGNNVALLAAILFAVMPFTWMIRRVLLESILLPFLLSSILLACYAGRTTDSKRMLLILASGAMLGLAIFTKIPAFAAIPVVAYLVLKPATSDGDRKTRTRWKATNLGLWLIPVIMIPMIWPIYASYSGHFDSWLRDALWQSRLKNDVITGMWAPFAKVDPVLLILGTIGVVYAAFKRDYFLLVWFVPFAALFSVVGFHQYFHVLPIVPVFCIASSRWIVDATAKLLRKKGTSRIRLLSWSPVIALAVFGLTITTILINTHLTSAQIQAAVFGINYVNTHKDVTISANPAYSWLFPYAFHLPNTLRVYGDIRYYEADTAYVLLLTDVHFEWDFSGGEVEKVYNSTEILASFEGEVSKYNQTKYPYTNMEFNEGARIDARIGPTSVLSPNGIFRQD
jgi:4-amino-4-deoxy-L-arabinose transferase-like glycosyltransferase